MRLTKIKENLVFSVLSSPSISKMLKPSVGLKLYVGLAIASAFYHVLDRAVGF